MTDAAASPASLACPEGAESARIAALDDDSGSHVIRCPECGVEIVYWTTDPWRPEVIHDGGSGTHTLQWGEHREAAQEQPRQSERPRRELKVYVTVTTDLPEHRVRMLANQYAQELARAVGSQPVRANVTPAGKRGGPS